MLGDYVHLCESVVTLFYLNLFPSNLIVSRKNVDDEDDGRIYNSMIDYTSVLE